MSNVEFVNPPLLQLRDLERLFINENSLIFGEEILGDKIKIEIVQNELEVRFHLPRFDFEIMNEILRYAKRYMHTIKIRSWQNDEYRFIAWQDETMKENFDQKFSFSLQGMLGYYTLTARRKGGMSANEANFVLDCYRLVFAKRKEVKPEDVLQELGVMVYNSEAEFSWDYLSGYENVKREVMESVILPLKHPEIYQGVADLARKNNAGKGNLPRAVLFTGPPGVGKTTMARMIAREVGVPMIYIPIESIISKYYGESSKNLMTIFNLAGSMGKVILFLDEIDSLAGSRDNNMFEATRRVLSVLLRYLDGFETKGEIITLGATNRKSDLDPALISRFDHTVNFPLPDQGERMAIIQSFAKHLNNEELKVLAEKCNGFSGRNLKDITQYAERWWARHLILQKKEISAPPLESYLKAVQSRIEIN